MIRIVIAEDQGMMLDALSALLEMEKDFTVVGKANNGQAAIEIVEREGPDICIMDIEMPEKNGLDAADALKSHPCKVIILTTFARAGYFARAKTADVRGYLLKDSPIEDLAFAIREISKGRKIYDPELVDYLYANRDEMIENPLTAREMDVLKLMARGKSTKTIASHLNLKQGTVRNYISIILEKLQVSNRIEAITKCQTQGWLHE